MHVLRARCAPPNPPFQSHTGIFHMHMTVCCVQVYFPDHPGITAQVSRLTGGVMSPQLSAILLLGGMAILVALGSLWPYPSAKVFLRVRTDRAASTPRLDL